MADRESMTTFIGKVVDKAEADGLTVDALPVQIRNLRMNGKGKKMVQVVSMELVLDPESFAPEYRDNISHLFKARFYGVVMAIPTEFLKKADTPVQEEKVEPGPGDQLQLF